MRREFGEHSFELGLEQLESRDLAVAKVGGAIEMLGLFEAGLADRFPQGTARGRLRYGFDTLFHPRSLLALGLSISLQGAEMRQKCAARNVRRKAAISRREQRMHG